eukprot:COSAG01_NODE_1568_length_9874_cov_15.549872_1_plen_152_part_00
MGPRYDSLKGLFKRQSLISRQVAEALLSASSSQHGSPARNSDSLSSIGSLLSTGGSEAVHEGAMDGGPSWLGRSLPSGGNELATTVVLSTTAAAAARDAQSFSGGNHQPSDEWEQPEECEAALHDPSAAVVWRALCDYADHAQLLPPHYLG